MRYDPPASFQGRGALRAAFRAPLDTLPKRLGITLVILAGCGGGDATHVSLDLSPLWDASGQSSQIDVIHVRVFDDAGAPVLDEVLTDTDATLDVDVTAGPQRRFEVEAVYDDATGATLPTFWGDAVVDLVAQTTVDLVVPIFPAGRLTGTAEASDGAVIPDTARLVATALQPRPDAPVAPEVRVDGGRFEVTLPTGDYDLTLDLDVGGTAYARTDGGGPVTVSQGTETAGITVVVGPQ